MIDSAVIVQAIILEKKSAFSETAMGSAFRRIFDTERLEIVIRMTLSKAILR